MSLRSRCLLFCSCSLALEFALELLCEAPVGLESGITSLLLQSGIPVIELVEAVTEAQTLLHRQVAHVFLLSALGVASVMKVCKDGVVLLQLEMVEVFGTQLRVLQSLSKQRLMVRSDITL